MRRSRTTRMPKNTVARPRLRMVLPVGAVLLGISALAAATGSWHEPTSVATADTDQIRDDLRNQVDTPSGAPLPGRDPATQAQSSLADAASSPNGVGRRTDRPAAAASADHGRDAAPTDVLANSRKTGLSAAGCFADYGVPGQQCVPAHVATKGALTCVGVRSLFSDGVVVSGRDRFHLDTNHDGTACGRGDA